MKFASLMMTMLVVLAGCSGRLYIDATSPDTDSADTAILNCDSCEGLQTGICGICTGPIIRLSDNAVIAESKESFLFSSYIKEVVLDPGAYKVRLVQCAARFPGQTSNYVTYFFKAIPGHIYDVHKSYIGSWCFTNRIVDRESGEVVSKYAERQLEEQERLLEAERELEALQKRAHAGEASAQYELFTLVDDKAEEISWLCRAAHNGHPRAQVELARRYWYDLAPVSEDRAIAFMWSSFAAAQEFEGGKIDVAERRPLLTPEEAVEAERLVAEWQPNLNECEIIAAMSEN